MTATRPPTQTEIVSVLEQMTEFGADETIDEQPRKRKTPEDAGAVSVAVSAADVAVAVAVSAADDDAKGSSPPPHHEVHLAGRDSPPPAKLADAAASAAQDAFSAANLESLWKAIQAFDGCPLKRGAQNTVIWRGNPAAKVAIVGEAPGADEDAQGKPFVGRAGKLLDRLLHWAGFDADDVFITNVIFWRPSENRTPTTEEVETCLPFVRRQLTLLDPAVVLLLGNTPLKALLPEQGSRGITRARGRWEMFAPEEHARMVACLASFHPAYLLRSPAQTRLAWRDVLSLAARYEAETGLILPRRPQAGN
ncbi:MAG: uracil-DNA glycosylase [Alphaproteobacteria bacterium]|nr:uracil-DNA glycosylase [Alphaproteobacteria bacterium]MDA7983747.1 uracil-DNA glycosylase [Alphaproteobacteria bacterium]MDA7989158.1 uracil-DNA glycosylase [Alphaproteobacteria bacterium]